MSNVLKGSWKIDIKLLSDNAKIPTRATEDSAGYDIYAALDKPYAINPGTVEKISTGISMAIPKGKFGAIFPRSGLAAKMGLRLANCVAVIDADYRGEIFIAIYNDSSSVQFIYPGDRIAQLIILDYNTITFNQVDNLDQTVRGEGGFGSTGLK